MAERNWNGSSGKVELFVLDGLFMLKELAKKKKKNDKGNIGSYRDDGLSVFKKDNDHQNDKVWKEIIDLFK